ncbi:cyclin-like protein, partial [Obelidium mucronatum]
KSWLFTRQQLDTLISQNGESLTYVERQHVHQFYMTIMTSIAKILKLRQQILATAAVFFLRYHVKRPFINRKQPHIDAILVAATCVYLAAKVEEHPFHIKAIVQAVQSPSVLGANYAIDMVKISDLDFYMVVFHPYQSVALYIKDLGFPKEPGTIFLQNAWMLINDTYRSDLPLLYPPHMIALGVIYLTAAMQEKMVESIDFGLWFSRVNVQPDQILILVQQLLDLYQTMSLYDGPATLELINKLKLGIYVYLLKVLIHYV